MSENKTIYQKAGIVTIGADYIHTLRETKWSVLRLLISIPVYALFVALFSVISFLLLGVVASQLGGGREFMEALKTLDIDKLSYSERVNDLVLFALFPAGIVTNMLVFNSRGTSLLSVEKGIRWRWIGYCALVLVPVMGITIAAQEFLTKHIEIRATGTALKNIGITFALTPLQCMGEEMFFRAWTLQLFGPIFKNKKLGWIILSIVLSIGFVLPHDATNVFVMLSMFTFAVTACALIYITGGIEAGIIMHTINNVTLFIITYLSAGGVDFNASAATGAAASRDAIISTVFNVIYFIVAVLAWKRYTKKQSERLNKKLVSMQSEKQPDE